MIELTLTEEQRRELEQSDSVPAVDAVTREEYVLLPRSEYARLKEVAKEPAYDLDPVTDEERDAMIMESGSKFAGWDDMSEYDDYPEKP